MAGASKEIVTMPVLGWINDLLLPWFGFKNVVSATSSAIMKPLTDGEERRAKREARRAKQRVENVGRAAEMHDARLAWESAANRALPSTGRPSAREFHVGCSGWFYWHWRGGFYAADMQTGTGSLTTPTASRPWN